MQSSSPRSSSPLPTPTRSSAPTRRRTRRKPVRRGGRLRLRRQHAEPRRRLLPATTTTTTTTTATTATTADDGAVGDGAADLGAGRRVRHGPRQPQPVAVDVRRRRRGPEPARGGRRLLDGRDGGEQRAVRGVRRGDGPRHRLGALQLVVRLRAPADGGGERGGDPVGARRAVVDPRRRRELARAGRAGVGRARRWRCAPGGARLVD